MEDLNKNQLILLTLLVSFVTSIATGIITTSLLQEAPPSVTQVINRVVERTVEQVTTESGQVQTVREVVVVKEEDQVVDAISKNSPSIVRLTDNALVDGVNVFYGIGFLASKDGPIVSARRDSINPSSTYSAVFGDGSRQQVKVTKVDDVNRLVFFEIIDDAKVPLKVGAVSFSSGGLQLGQTIITVDGRENNSVSIGRVTALKKDQSGANVGVETDIASAPLTVGAPYLNLSGEVVGIRVLFGTGNHTFTPTSVIKQSMAQ
jgi:hypothetical protein